MDWTSLFHQRIPRAVCLALGKKNTLVLVALRALPTFGFEIQCFTSHVVLHVVFDLIHVALHVEPRSAQRPGSFSFASRQRGTLHAEYVLVALRALPTLGLTALCFTRHVILHVVLVGVCLLLLCLLCR